MGRFIDLFGWFTKQRKNSLNRADHAWLAGGVIIIFFPFSLRKKMAHSYANKYCNYSVWGTTTIYLEFTIKYMDPHDLDDGVILRSGKGSAHLRTPYPSNPSKLQFFGGYRMGLQKWFESFIPYFSLITTFFIKIQLDTNYSCIYW